ncbi:hypothetical protein Q4S45_14880 [Massilia sp. R2A-15]|uniref:hypothetical protein n=1 Tax=Massilia sp. R2A-15 TaxID=3064278 RepID=UPI002734E9CD|nr:hypothetical protein [Massilia sp. R2A-15]WLI88022.1 hypothetical protein Q4S45_14880 [Massilia sp. R2A-15]
MTKNLVDLGPLRITFINIGTELMAGQRNNSGLALRIFSAHIFMGVIAIGLSQSIGPIGWEVIVPFCGASILLLMYLFLVRVVRNPSSLILDPIVCFALATAVYFGFGPLLYVFGPNETAEYSLAWYPTDPRAGLWLIALHFIGIGITGITCISTRFNAVSRAASVCATRWARISTEKVVVFFIVVGMLFRFFFVIPYEFGMIKMPPSALVRALQNFVLVGFFIGFSLPRMNRSLRKLLKYALVVQVGTSILMFNKTEVLLAVLSAGLGMFIARGRIMSLVSMAGIAIAIYVVLGPLVLFGRNQLLDSGTDGMRVAGMIDRGVLVQEYLESRRTGGQSGETEAMWWYRLNYIPSQHAAVDLYNEGRGSESFKNVLWLFVPRSIYPDKPILSSEGAMLTDKVHGFSTSSTGIGVFADGYYNFGWFGVVLSAITYGLVLSVYRCIARPIINQKAFALYPLALVGVTVAIRPDGWWLLDVAGPVILVLAGLFLVRSFSESKLRFRG